MLKKVRYSLILLLTLFWFHLPAQIVITEIMYNDPSAGTAGDSLEFIEVYNTADTLVDLTGFQFTTGVTFTFPSAQLDAGNYLVIARTMTAYNAFFSQSTTLQWDAGQNLSNNGEAIVLKNSLGGHLRFCKVLQCSSMAHPGEWIG